MVGQMSSKRRRYCVWLMEAVEWWGNGGMEYWGDGVMDHGLHHTPILQYSITPLPPHSLPRGVGPANSVLLASSANRSRSSYFCCHVVYITPITPLTRRAASSHSWISSGFWS